jgi:5-methylcytosine-specific restriction endonuclease McrA
MAQLLTRDEFRNSVFERDRHRCVICGSEGKLDAHHIIERRLWTDGGCCIGSL